MTSTLTREGTTTITYFAADKAGNSETPKTLAVSIDTIPPTVTSAGNSGSYTIDQAVNITCAASDPLPGSGLASTTCPDINGPAYGFLLGPNTYSATATDVAGNVGGDSTSFTVTVTPGSLCQLTKQFVQNSASYQALTSAQKAVVEKLATKLCDKVALIVPTLTPAQKARLVLAYQLGVQALVPLGWLTQAQADVLKTDASVL